MTSVHSVRSQSRLTRNDLQPAIPTPKDLFFPVTLYIPPAAVSPEEEPIELPSSPEYTAVVARIDASQVYLTASMAATVKALLSVLNTHLSPLTVHPLVQLVASPETTNEKLVELATKTEAGLNAFLARKGPASIPAARADPSADPPVANTQDQPMPSPAAESSPVPSPNASRAAVSTRSQRVHRGCVERDRSICQLTNQADSGVVSHIIPFSVQGSKAIDFWNLVALFRGEAEAVALQVAALGTTSDTIRNVWWLSEAAHTRFDKGWISVVPQLSDVPFPYNPETVAEYHAIVEFPFGSHPLPSNPSSRPIALPVINVGDDGTPHFLGFLKPGDTIILRTPNPSRLPLPHPLLFQLHTICSRVLAAKAAAGYPQLDESDDPSPVEHLVDVGESEGYSVSDGSCAAAPPLRRVVAAEEHVGEEVSRIVDVVEMGYRKRMEDMWDMCSQKLGRAPHGARWWNAEVRM